MNDNKQEISEEMHSQILRLVENIDGVYEKCFSHSLSRYQEPWDTWSTKLNTATRKLGEEFILVKNHTDYLFMYWQNRAQTLELIHNWKGKRPEARELARLGTEHISIKEVLKNRLIDADLIEKIFEGVKFNE